AVGVCAPEGPYRALEVPVVTADVGAHGDRVAVVHVAPNPAPPFWSFGVGLRSTVGQADSVEDLAVVVEQRGGAGEREPPDVPLDGALFQEALVEGVLTEIRVEVPLERFERLGEVEAVPHHVAQHGDV